MQRFLQQHITIHSNPLGIQTYHRYKKSHQLRLTLEDRVRIWFRTLPNDTLDFYIHFKEEFILNFACRESVFCFNEPTLLGVPSKKHCLKNSDSSDYGDKSGQIQQVGGITKSATLVLTEYDCCFSRLSTQERKLVGLNKVLFFFRSIS